jgi:hypothetical protein
MYLLKINYFVHYKGNKAGVYVRIKKEERSVYPIFSPFVDKVVLLAELYLIEGATYR